LASMPPLAAPDPQSFDIAPLSPMTTFEDDADSIISADQSCISAGVNDAGSDAASVQDDAQDDAGTFESFDGDEESATPGQVVSATENDFAVPDESSAVFTALSEDADETQQTSGVLV